MGRNAPGNKRHETLKAIIQGGSKWSSAAVGLSGSRGLRGAYTPGSKPASQMEIARAFPEGEKRHASTQLGNKIKARSSNTCGEVALFNGRNYKANLNFGHAPKNSEMPSRGSHAAMWLRMRGGG